MAVAAISMTVVVMTKVVVPIVTTPPLDPTTGAMLAQRDPHSVIPKIRGEHQS